MGGEWYVLLMRQIVTGIDANGDSCVVEEIPFMPSENPLEIQDIFQTSTSPPPARPIGRALDLDFAVPPGILRAMYVKYGPGRESQMHHTDTIDFVTIISGRLDLLLSDGAHSLHRGDCAVINGVDHSWTAGPEGCTFSSVSLGTVPR